MYFVSIHPNLSGWLHVLSRPGFSQCRIGHQKVGKPSCRHGKPNKINAKTWCTDQCHGQADRKVYHVGNEEWLHDSESAKDSIGRHFNSHKDKEVTKPSHIIPRHLISQGGSVFSKEQ